MERTCSYSKETSSVRRARKVVLLMAMLFSAGIVGAFASTHGGGGERTQDTTRIRGSLSVQRVVTGVVLDENRDTLPGVTVMLKGTTTGVVTDIHGRYTLNIPMSMENPVICFSFVGKKTKEVTFTGQTELNVTLESEHQEIEEVVVTGYQNLDPRQVTSAIQTIKMDDIIVPGINTIDKLLEGHVPGMTFMRNSGQVGASPRLRIRGTSTVLGTQEPLWVLDGIPLTDPVNVDPAQINDLDFVNLLGNAIAGLNPQDIEQIDILKDASATALYGTQAANGVIVITTKKGNPGPPSVSYSLTGTFSPRSRYTNKEVYVMNSKERIDYSRESVEKGLTYPSESSWVGYEGALRDFYNGNISYDEFQSLVNYYETLNEDWFDIICRDAFNHNHTLSISGGSNNMKYYASLGYGRDNGMLRKEYMDRYTGMLSVNLNLDKFTMMFRISGNVQEKHYTPPSVGLMEYAYNTSRAVPATNADGSYWYYPKKMDRGFSVNFNVLNERDNSSWDVTSSGVNMSAQLGYRFFDGFKADFTFSYALNHTDDETWFGENTAYAASLRGDRADAKSNDANLMPFGGELKRESTRNQNYMLRLQLNYTKYLDKDQVHMINAALGGELSSTQYKGFEQTHRGYLKERGLQISTFDPEVYPDFAKWLTTTQEARGVVKDELTNKLSGYATVSYSYQDLYVLNANIRFDASNKFGSQANKKILPVWSVSARWNAKEDVIAHWSWVNNLSLRASFGYQGNMLDSETPELIISKGDWDSLREFYKSSVHKFPNPDLSWEKTASFNATADFGFFKNRLSGSVSYFYKKTRNAFLNKQISIVNGVKNYTVNEGTVENQGVEFAMQIYPVPPGLGAMGGDKKGFIWRIDPQIGQVINKLVNKVINDRGRDNSLHDDYTYQNFLDGQAEVSGRPLNSFFSYEFTGLNPKNGQPTFARIGEENWEKYAEMTNDEVCLEVMDYSGCRVPYLQGGISNTFGYRNFTLSFNLAYSIGSKVRLLKLYGNTGTTQSAFDPVQNLRKEFVDRWKNPGDERHTNIPGIQTQEDWFATTETSQQWWNGEAFSFGENIWQMYNESDVRVVSGNYLKLQSLSLRYNVPDDFCKKLNLKSMYLSFSTTDLFTWSAKELKGQDPTTQSGSAETISVPARPTYSLQLNVSF